MRYDRFVLDQELYAQGSSGDTFVSKMMTTMYTFKICKGSSTQDGSRHTGQLALARQAPVDMLSKPSSCLLTALWHFLHRSHEILIATSTPHQQLVAAHLQTQLVRTQSVLARTHFFQGRFQTALLH